MRWAFEWFDSEADAKQNVCAAIEKVSAKLGKAQPKSKLIFLTHKEGLHELNLRRHLRAEEWLWRPDIQERK